MGLGALLRSAPSPLPDAASSLRPAHGWLILEEWENSTHHVPTLSKVHLQIKLTGRLLMKWCTFAKTLDCLNLEISTSECGLPFIYQWTMIDKMGFRCSHTETTWMPTWTWRRTYTCCMSIQCASYLADAACPQWGKNTSKLEVGDHTRLLPIGQS